MVGVLFMGVLRKCQVIDHVFVTRVADGAVFGPVRAGFESIATVVDGGAEMLLAVRDGGDAGEAGDRGCDERGVQHHGAAPFCLSVG
jgi:hypothetical protein